jgi:hypothetical protein
MQLDLFIRMQQVRHDVLRHLPLALNSARLTPSNQALSETPHPSPLDPARLAAAAASVPENKQFKQQELTASPAE